jgi:hypothetical protein
MVFCPNGAQGDSPGQSEDWLWQRSLIDAPRRPSKRPAEGLIPSSSSHWISSYSYSVRRGGRYSVQRYSYSMAVLTAAMPIVDRGGSR